MIYEIKLENTAKSRPEVVEADNCIVDETWVSFYQIQGETPITVACYKTRDVQRVIVKSEPKI